VKYKECKSEQITLMKGESLFSGSVSAFFCSRLWHVLTIWLAGKEAKKWLTKRKGVCMQSS